jgi:hypothetical protein
MKKVLLGAALILSMAGTETAIAQTAQSGNMTAVAPASKDNNHSQQGSGHSAINGQTQDNSATEHKTSTNEAGASDAAAAAAEKRNCCCQNLGSQQGDPNAPQNHVEYGG